MNFPRTTLLRSAILASLIVCSLSAQTPFDVVAIGKGRDFIKNSSGNPVPDPNNGFGNLSFWVDVTGPSFGSGIAAPVVTLASGSTYPTVAGPAHNGGTLLFNSDNEWGYGSPNGNGIATTSLTNLNNYFAHGAYSVNVLGNTVNLDLTLPGVPFPVVPNFSFSQGTWTGGVLRFDPSQDLTITVMNLASFTSGVNGTPAYATGGVGAQANLLLHDGSDAVADIQYFSRIAPPGGTINEAPTSLTFTLSANPLNAGKSYFGEALFTTFLDYNTTHGYLNVSMVESLTSFQMQAIPEPSAYAALAGLGTLGLALWRRRRTLSE